MTALRPSLDDQTYAQLLEEARAAIPSLAPQWTDHNPSDPGIALLELFAFFAEALVYRADQLPDDRYDAFLRLLRGPAWSRQGSVDDAVAETLALLRTPWRAATAADIELLVLHDWPASPEAAQLGADSAAVRRVQAVPDRDLEAGVAEPASGAAPPAALPAPGHLSLVVVPDRADAGAQPLPSPTPQLRQALWAWLEPRRLLGVRHHVVGPAYVNVAVRADLVLRDDYAPLSTTSSGVLTDHAIVSQAAREVVAALQRHFDPLVGGSDGSGWPFGRNVYLSDVFRLLDGLPGVDYVQDLSFVGTPAERVLSAGAAPGGSPGDDVIGVRIDSHELVALSTSDDPTRADRIAVSLPASGAGR